MRVAEHPKHISVSLVLRTFATRPMVHGDWSPSTRGSVPRLWVGRDTQSKRSRTDQPCPFLSDRPQSSGKTGWVPSRGRPRHANGHSMGTRQAECRSPRCHTPHLGGDEAARLRPWTNDVLATGVMFEPSRDRFELLQNSANVKRSSLDGQYGRARLIRLGIRTLKRREQVRVERRVWEKRRGRVLEVAPCSRTN